VATRFDKLAVRYEVTIHIAQATAGFAPSNGAYEPNTA
jgi:hypothetical protein